jgi:hypothetical protein
VRCTRVAASAALILAFVLVALPGLHPDGREHHVGPPGVTAFSADLEGWAHAPDCALCRVTSQVRSALHDPAEGHAPTTPQTRLAFHPTAELAPGAPTRRGTHARAPPSA